MSKMIHARRRMVTEDDRYGGYRRRDFSKDSAQGRAFGGDARTSSAQEQTRSYTYDHGMTELQEPHVEVGEPVSYSGRDFSTDIGLVPATKFAKSKPTQEQIMPRIQDPAEERLQQKRREIEQKTAQQQAKPVPRAKTSVSTKVALVVYITAILLLTGIVVGTGIAINNATDRIDALESQRSAMVQTLTTQDYELAMLSDADYLAGLALGQDMEKIDSYIEVEMIELSEPRVYTPPSNWFDSFCDWMSGLFQ